MNRRAFTLIELLVVIAVIATLVAIILPALSHGRRTAQSAVSKVQLGQWGNVQAAYGNDFKNSFVNPFDAKNPQQWVLQWYAVIGQASLNVTNPSQIRGHNFGDPEYCTLLFADEWAALAAQYLNSTTNASSALLSPNDTAALLRYRKHVPLNVGVEDEYLYSTSYWASPTLWLGKEPFRTSSRVTIGYGDSRYWRRNRFDDAIFSDGKVMVFERFDFTKTTRARRSGGREKYSPMFNNPEANTRFVTVDGSVSSVPVSKLFKLTAPTNTNQSERDLYTPAGFWDVPDVTLGDPFTLAGAAKYDLGRDALENGDGTLLGIPGGLNKYPAFFWATRNGIQGRDIPR